MLLLYTAWGTFLYMPLQLNSAYWALQEAAVFRDELKAWRMGKRSVPFVHQEASGPTEALGQN